MRPRIHIIGKPKLIDSAQALKVRMLNKVKNQLEWNRNETVNRVVENLVFVNKRQG